MRLIPQHLILERIHRMRLPRVHVRIQEQTVVPITAPKCNEPVRRVAHEVVHRLVLHKRALILHQLEQVRVPVAVHALPNIKALLHKDPEDVVPTVLDHQQEGRGVLPLEVSHNV